MCKDERVGDGKPVLKVCYVQKGEKMALHIIMFSSKEKCTYSMVALFCIC